MVFVPFDNTYQVEMLHSEHGQNMENVLYFQPTAEISEDDANALIDALIAWEIELCAPLRSDESSHDQVRLRELSNPAGLLIIRQVIPATLGTVASPSMPGNVTAAVTLRTSRAGRSYRGRNYWIGLCEDQVNGDSISTDVLAGVVSAYEELLAGDLFAGHYQLCVASRVHNGAPRDNGVATPVTQITMDSIVDSQRRRLTGRGH